jgi:hypothetical protein
MINVQEKFIIEIRLTTQKFKLTFKIINLETLTRINIRVAMIECFKD